MGIGKRLLQFSAVLIAGLFIFASQPVMADAALLKKADKQITSEKFKAAVRTITKAMNSGGLTDKQMAKALYKRGVAYNGVKRYSAAIADLTGALWLTKLDGTSKKLAHQERAFAYQSTGHKKLAARDFARSGQQTPGRQRTRKAPAIAKAPPPIPSFNTVVRKEKQRKTHARTKVAAKPAVKKKPAIPAFRTTIAAE